MAKKYTGAKVPLPEDKIPRPPSQCAGKLYKVTPTETLGSIARKFETTVEAILAANPQIVNQEAIFVGQLICLPTRPPQPPPAECDLTVQAVSFLTEAGQPLPTVNGSVQLNRRVIVRATFNRPVSRAFFFLEPTGTETCELASLIGIDCPSAVTGVAEILWQVPPGTLGRVFMVACINNCCAKSNEILVVRNS